MKRSEDTIVVNATVEMTTRSLGDIVSMAKALTGRDHKGHYHVDTAEAVNKMISRFLLEKNFESYVRQKENYDGLFGPGEIVC
jgi:hypothetical protein